MKRKGFIILAMLISCFLWIHGAWAATVGYIDSGQNSVIFQGVVGAKYTGTAGTGVYGDASADTGYTQGGVFTSSSTTGKGVYGNASASTGPTYGGYFLSWSTGGTGVYGAAPLLTGYTFGGWFESSSTTGTGVNGYASADGGYTYGGYFSSDSTSGTGVYAYAHQLTGATYGGYFLSRSASGKGVYGLTSAVTGATYGGWLQSKSSTGRGVYGLASSTTGVNYGVYGKTNSPSGYGVYSKGRMKVEGNQIVTGNQTVTGTKSAVVKLKNGESVSLYAVESSENWFEDFGSSTLKEGTALVKIDPTFAETVNTDMDYHVFLTPKGECKGLYVTNQKGTSFEVRELNGGKSDISFSYRIVAKRKGHEDKRLARVNDEEMADMTTAEVEDMQKDGAIELASHVR